MRLTSALTAIIATSSAVSAAFADCNPSYNVTSSGSCFTDCNVKSGSTYLSGWTMDHASPLFLDSLKVMCSKGTSQYTAFMTTAGICMVNCSNPELFAAEFAGACSWYEEHKNDTCASNSTIRSNATTSDSQAASTSSSISVVQAKSSASKMQHTSALIFTLAVGAAYLVL